MLYVYLYLSINRVGMMRTIRGYTQERLNQGSSLKTLQREWMFAQRGTAAQAVMAAQLRPLLAASLPTQWKCQVA